MSGGVERRVAVAFRNSIRISDYYDNFKKYSDSKFSYFRHEFLALHVLFENTCLISRARKLYIRTRVRNNVTQWLLPHAQ